MRRKKKLYSQLEGKYFLGRAGQPAARAQMEATHHMSKYLKVLNQTNELLNKICSTLLPWQKYFQNHLRVRREWRTQTKHGGTGRWAWPLSMAHSLWATSPSLHIPGSVPPHQGLTHKNVDTSVLSTTLPTTAVPWPRIRPRSVHSAARQPSRREEGRGEEHCAGLWKQAGGRNGRQFEDLRYQKHSVKEGGADSQGRHPLALWLLALDVYVWGVGCGVQTQGGPSTAQGPRQGPLLPVSEGSSRASPPFWGLFLTSSFEVAVKTLKDKVWREKI